MVKGVLPDKEIKELISKGIIEAKSPILKEQIQPSSLDLRLGEDVFCIPYSCIPYYADDLEKFFRENSLYRVDLGKNRLLHKGKVYVTSIKESLYLPEHLAAKSNPKSSIGRTDIHVRLITEKGKCFDYIRAGYRGRLWLEIYSRSFDILIGEDISLNQIRIFDRESKRISGGKLKEIHEKEGILFDSGNSKIESLDDILEDGSISLSVELNDELPGYVARHDAPPVDLLKRDHPIEDYFDVVKIKNNGIILREDSFYILNSKEVINTPNGYCAEMSDVETTSGEFRVHYAGFFDTGFCAQAVVEVRNLGHPFLLRKGQKIANINFYPLRSLPQTLYGKEIKSNYQGQRGPKLAKFFAGK